MTQLNLDCNYQKLYDLIKNMRISDEEISIAAYKVNLSSPNFKFAREIENYFKNKILNSLESEFHGKQSND